jgi:2-hydroxychromene-2-carboxylate isomerase
MVLFKADARAFDLARSLAAAAWSEGRDLTDVGVIAAVLDELELDSSDLAGRLADPDLRQALVHETEDALEAGVFGVPIFEYEGELFWGHDRLRHLSARLWGRLRPARQRSQALLERPVGVERRR